MYWYSFIIMTKLSIENSLSVLCLYLILCKLFVDAVILTSSVVQKSFLLRADKRSFLVSIVRHDNVRKTSTEILLR